VPDPIALCIEDLDAEPRYLRCVAIVGRAPGLALDHAGGVCWLPTPDTTAIACELWVSGDAQLMLYRTDPSAGPAPEVHRGGRSLCAPAGKPVVLLDQDEVHLAGRRLRFHIHGPASAVHSPEPLPAERQTGKVLRAAAAALAIGAAVGAAGCKAPIEVRTNPPSVEATPPDAARPDAKPTKPIEVRVAPPQQPPPTKPTPAPTKPTPTKPR